MTSALFIVIITVIVNITIIINIEKQQYLQYFYALSKSKVTLIEKKYIYINNLFYGISNHKNTRIQLLSVFTDSL